MILAGPGVDVGDGEGGEKAERTALAHMILPLSRLTVLGRTLQLF